MLIILRAMRTTVNDESRSPLDAATDAVPTGVIVACFHANYADRVEQEKRGRCRQVGLLRARLPPPGHTQHLRSRALHEVCPRHRSRRPAADLQSRQGTAGGRQGAVPRVSKRAVDGSVLFYDLHDEPYSFSRYVTVSCRQNH